MTSLPSRQTTAPLAIHRVYGPRVLAFAALLLAAALAAHGPVAQWVSYHAFADAREWLGLPNAENVLSNLPFAGIGAWACLALRRAPGMAAWRVFSAALVATAFGSAAYHWAPGNGLLVADRLPIAWACSALLCAFLAERVDPRWEGMPALCAVTAAASASVAWWWFTEQHGVGDLRPYLFVQFLPMLLVPIALWLKLPLRSAAGPPDATWWSVLGLYGAAKLMELADQPVFDTLGFVSGHTLKHLLAAAAALCLVRTAVGVARQLRWSAEITSGIHQLR